MEGSKSNLAQQEAVNYPISYTSKLHHGVKDTENEIIRARIN